MTMKKLYMAPMVEVMKTQANSIICVSASFGDGETDTMHSREELENIDFDQWDW